MARYLLANLGRKLTSGGWEMRSESFPPTRPTTARTGAIEERDNGKFPGWEYRYKSAEESGLPVFYSPPRMREPGELISDLEIKSGNAVARSGLEHASPVKVRSRSIIIEIASAQRIDPNPVPPWMEYGQKVRCLIGRSMISTLIARVMETFVIRLTISIGGLI